MAACVSSAALTLTTLTPKQKELRKRARTDLFWLARNVLGYDRMLPRIHQPLCDFFVQKDRTRSFEEQDTVKQRLVLDPRDHFKTTLDVADIVQWFLNFPHIRILLMTGTEKLATRMLGEAKSHFFKNEKMRQLFPEYCSNKEFGNSSEFTLLENQHYYKEPSMSISTIDSTKAGGHYDIIKCDDLVHENNINTAELIEKTITAFNYTTPLLEPYGYRDVIGTRYDYSDLYGWIMENNHGAWKVFARKAASVPFGPDSKVLFPERFPIEKLLEIQRADPYIFNCQYLNDPTPTERAQFTDELMTSHTIPHLHIPRNGRIFITWDLGFSQREFADWSVGAVGLFDDQGRLFILDINMGRYSSYELVQQFFNLLLKWRPSRVGIEEAAGSPLLAPALEMYSRQRRIHLPLDWLKVKNTKHDKEERIGSLLPLLYGDKLYFSANMPNREEVFKQFVRFPRYKHNDAPDAISRLLHYRNCVDFAWPDNEVDMSMAATVEGSEVLGCGLVG